MNNQIRHEPDDRPEAVRQAGAGARAWRAVVHAQQSATPDHADFYALAAELVDTLSSVSSLAGVLARQVETYAQRQPAGERVYDDSRTVDPVERLGDAAQALRALHDIVGDDALRLVNGFWNAIGHIGVEDIPGTDSGPVEDDGVSR
jgi:hypothetical protein